MWFRAEEIEGIDISCQVITVFVTHEDQFFDIDLHM